MKKRIGQMMALLIALIMTVGLLPVQTQAANNIGSGKCGDGVYWSLDSAGVLTISTDGTPGSHDMWSYGIDGGYLHPSWFENRDQIRSAVIEDGVTSIGGSAFQGCSSLTSVTIPGSVTTIGRYAFDNCRSLTSVVIPDGVTTIVDYAFARCSSLTSVTIPSSLTTIGRYAFSGTPWFSSLGNFAVVNNILFNYQGDEGAVTIPDGVTKIENSTFEFCTNLTSVTIPNSVTTIGDRAFFGCSSLTSVTIPNSVTKIGGGAFSNCKNLTSVTIPDSVIEIGVNAFGTGGRTDEIGYLGDARGDTPWFNNLVKKSGDFVIANRALLRYQGSSTSITIPSGVTTIGGCAFDNCGSLTSVTIPDGVTTIGDSAFRNCSSLTSVTIPNSVTKIGEGAFYGCGSLTNVTIPSSVTEIGEDAFMSCKMTSVTIPKGVTEIKKGTFSYCTNLTSVVIPNGVTAIGERAFDYCGSLTSVVIPDGVTKIGHHAFNFCTSLASVTIPNSVIEIGGGAFWACASLTSVNIPSSVTKIKDDAFAQCALTSVTIPNSVIEIGQSAFWNCKNLTSAVIPSSVTKISATAFKGCENLTIYGYKGSYAERYANENNIPFVVLIVNAEVSGWAREQVDSAALKGLMPDGLGNDFREKITRAQFAALAVKLYEAMSGQTAPAPGKSPFSDTSDPVIIQAHALGIVSGVGGGRFAPDDPVTREQAALMLSRVYTKLGGKIPEVAATTFADNGYVSSWARDAVAFMSSKKIVTGVGNNKFDPKGDASIEQAMVIALRMFENLK